MPQLRSNPNPSDLFAAYSDGLPGSPIDPVQRDQLIADGIVKFGADSISGLHRDAARKRVLHFKALRALDPTGLSDESQDTGDCTSHGSRNAADGSRAVEIIVDRQPDRWVARGATEYIYSGRGHGGQGMNAGHATKIIAKGQMLRRDYTDQGGPNLSKYNASIGIRQGRSGIPKDWADLAAKELHCTDWVQPRNAEEALDLMAAGYCGHAGSMFGTDRTTGRDGINRKSKSWSHDMANFGYDISQEIWKEPVVFVPNSWGSWNEPNPIWMANQDVLGPWIKGMLVVALDDYDRHIVKSGETYFLVEFVGDGIKARDLPDYGSDYNVKVEM